jgi:hypothetical protein
MNSYRKCKRIMQNPAWLAGALLVTAACAGKPPEQPAIEETRVEVQAYISSERVTDDRGRFREIFCAVLEERGRDLPGSSVVPPVKPSVWVEPHPTTSC